MDNLEQIKKQVDDASAGGKARAKKLTPEQRSEIAKKAALKRWGQKKSLVEQASGHSGKPCSEAVSSDDQQAFGHTRFEQVKGLVDEDIDDSVLPSAGIPVAIYSGVLDLVDVQIPCYVLNDGQRIIGRSAATQMLTGGNKSGQFERTISVSSLKPFLDVQYVLNSLVTFSIPDIEQLGKQVKGMPADIFVDVCKAFVDALNDKKRRDDRELDYPSLTDRQEQMAFQAAAFLASVAKVGFDALIDEATGYQFVREKDALQVKLKLNSS